MSLVYVRPGGGKLAVGAEAQRVFDQYRQTKARDNEAGGVLVGRLILDSKDVIIDKASEPSCWDRRTRFRFLRRARPAQKVVSKAWQASGGTQNYLGEWHSHPEDVPNPSGVDLDDWQRVVSRSSFEQDALFFIIVGRVETRAWELSRNAALTALARQDDSE